MMVLSVRFVKLNQSEALYRTYMPTMTRRSLIQLLFTWSNSWSLGYNRKTTDSDAGDTRHRLVGLRPTIPV